MTRHPIRKMERICTKPPDQRSVCRRTDSRTDDAIDKFLSGIL